MLNLHSKKDGKKYESSNLNCRNATHKKGKRQKLAQTHTDTHTDTIDAFVVTTAARRRQLQQQQQHQAQF